MSFVQVFARAVEMYTYVIFASVVLSWLPIDRSNPLVRLLDALTEPLYRPIRAILPPGSTGNLDFSPLIALVLLRLMVEAVARL